MSVKTLRSSFKSLKARLYQEKGHKCLSSPCYLIVKWLWTFFSLLSSRSQESMTQVPQHLPDLQQVSCLCLSLSGRQLWWFSCTKLFSSSSSFPTRVSKIHDSQHRSSFSLREYCIFCPSLLDTFCFPLRLTPAVRGGLSWIWPAHGVGSLWRGISEYLGIQWNVWPRIRLENSLYTHWGVFNGSPKHICRKLIPQDLGWRGSVAVGRSFMFDPTFRDSYSCGLQMRMSS